MNFWQLYFLPKGRIGRFSYWLWGFLLWFTFGVISVLFRRIFYVNSLVILPFFLFATIMLRIKRAHDINESGYFCWLMLIPIANIWLAFVLAFRNGTDGPNRFGPAPSVQPPVPELKEMPVSMNGVNPLIVEDLCPHCGSKVLIRKASNGKHAGKFFRVCSNYPKCRYVILADT